MSSKRQRRHGTAGYGRRTGFFSFVPQPDQFLPIAVIQGEGLFHENIFVRPKSPVGKLIVKGRGCGDDNRTNIRIIQNLVKFVRYVDIGIGFLHQRLAGLIAITDGFQNTELMKITDKVLTPVPGADDRYSLLCRFIAIVCLIHVILFQSALKPVSS